MFVPVYQMAAPGSEVDVCGLQLLKTIHVRSIFLQRDAMLAQYMLSACVRPSVSLLQAGIVSKRLRNAGSRNQRHTIVQWF